LRAEQEIFESRIETESQEMSEAEENTHCPFCDVTPHVGHGFVYVLIFEHNVVKVGQSANPSERVLQHLRASSLKSPAGYLFAVLDADRAERLLLNYFVKFRLNGAEWFIVPPEERQFLKEAWFRILDTKYWHWCGSHPQPCPACEALGEALKVHICDCEECVQRRERADVLQGA
jgi:T5orf172 domain